MTEIERPTARSGPWYQWLLLAAVLILPAAYTAALALGHNL